MAIALGIALQKEDIDFEDYFVFGELGLDGVVKDTAMIFPLVLSLAKKPIKVVVPLESLSKVQKIPNINIVAVQTLSEAITFFKTKKMPSHQPIPFSFPYLEADGEKYYYDPSYPLDFSEVKGQEVAKRAALVAAAGCHNLLMEGSPGCGKSMIAKRLRYILPPMSMQEILEMAKMAALDGKEPSFTPLRSYRSPHHSSTKASIFGGGSSGARPGEVAMAHKGILFFDELPHFAKSVLEALREPLQDHKVLISRVHSKVEYETTFLFVAAQNPCPCGNLLDNEKECRCTELEIKRYKNRLSEPLLDRIDLYVQMAPMRADDSATYTSQQMHEMVLQAFLMQKGRRQRRLNGKLKEQEIERYCILDDVADSILQQARDKFSLSHRSLANIKKVARTIADLEQKEIIEKQHILEALSYRRRTVAP